MSKLLNKLKMKKSLKSQIESEQTGNKKDPRFLNYYDLKEGEKMSVLWVPFTDGEMWAKYRKHGPNLKVKGKVVRGVSDVNCSHSSSSEDCPACQMGFDLLNLEKETGDKSYKEEAMKWFAKNYTIMQCIVLDSPMEIPSSPDGNEVKLVITPYKIEKHITEMITEGRIEEEDVFLTPFFIKKTKQGEFSNYDSSYFGRDQIDDETLSLFEDVMVEPYAVADLIGDVIPAPSTTEQVQEWLDKAEVLYMKETGQDDDSDDDKSEKEPPVKETSAKTSVASRLGKSRLSDKPSTGTNGIDDDVPIDLANQDSDEGKKEADAPKESIRDRLSRLKR